MPARTDIGGMGPSPKATSKHLELPLLERHSWMVGFMTWMSPGLWRESSGLESCSGKDEASIHTKAAQISTSTDIFRRRWAQDDESTLDDLVMLVVASGCPGLLLVLLLVA